ncbi:MAG TPA: hypothetical protein VKN16_21415 [Methylomirabilota bacterium]|nr:hypothetical protein [Methylomirabilota bacterium]
MGLYERFTGEESPRIRGHALAAILGEVERGFLTLSQASQALGLSAGEQTEALALLNRLVAPRDGISLGGFVTLTNIGTDYDTIAAAQGLGLVLLQTAGLTQVIFGVRVNKIGSGTQSWQLFNDTDSQQVAVIDDAGAAGIKTLSTTVDFDPPLGAGMKTIRVRAKSTVAQDDPVYFGATLSLRRASNLTSLELHEVTLLTDPTEPYFPATALKARLGV